MLEPEYDQNGARIRICDDDPNGLRIDLARASEPLNSSMSLHDEANGNNCQSFA
jgi:hypothetical protein